MIKRPNTNAQRLKRHKRVRAKISGTPECPRLNVFRSEKNIYAQVIDDVNGVTLCSASSLKMENGSNKEAAREVARWSLRPPSRRASKWSCLTAAAICITVVWPSWPKAPARAA